MAESFSAVDRIVDAIRSGAVVRGVRWGCVVDGCPRGFHGTKEDMPRHLAVCPSCGAGLQEIVELGLPHEETGA